MSTNEELIIQVHEFIQSVRRKNSGQVGPLETALLSMLIYDKPLEGATRDELLAMKGIGPVNVGYILRILKGEGVAAVVLDVPSTRSFRPYRMNESISEKTNWEGGLDNAVRIIEDK